MNGLNDARDGVVRTVVWRDIFPCLLLTRTLRISFRPSILLAAFGGYILMGLGGWFIGAVLFARAEDPLTERWHKEFLQITWGSRGVDRSFFEGAIRSPDREAPRSQHVLARLMNNAAVAPAVAWWQLTAPLIRLFHPDLSSTGLGYLLLCNAWNVVVWGLFGGAIARMAAFDFARQEAVGVARAVSQAGLKYPAHVIAPALAALALFLLAVPLIVIGALARLAPIAWVTGVLWLVVLIMGLLLAILAIGLIVGWLLLWATIAVEQSDAFDAVSRTYAYIYQRPLRFAGYVVYVAGLAIVGTLAVNLFATATVALTDWAVGWGSGAETIHMLQGRSVNPPAIAESTTPGEQPATVQTSRWLQEAAAGRRFWISALAAMAAAYPVGLLWCAAVGIYLLLRLHVDAAQTDEIAVDELEPLAGLPRLTPHESGIPGVEPAVPARSSTGAKEDFTAEAQSSQSQRKSSGPESKPDLDDAG